MAKYLVKFMDGSSQEYGVPGPDSESRRKNVIIHMETTTQKKVETVEKLDIPAPTKPKVKRIASESKSLFGPMQLSTPVKGKRGRKPKSEASPSNNAKKIAGLESTINLTKEINRLENIMMQFITQVGSEIESLKRIVLVSRRKELLQELNDLDMQLD